MPLPLAAEVVGDEAALVCVDAGALEADPARTAAPVYDPAASSKSETCALPPSAFVAKLKIAKR